MTSLHFRLLASLLVAGLSTAPLAAQQPLLPEQVFPQLEGVLRQAASQSPRMISRSLDLEMAAASREGYRAGMLPSVYGSYRITETRDDRADQTVTLRAQKVYYDVSVTQPVFHWGALRNNARIGEIQERISQGNYREAYRLLSQEIRSQYLQLIIKKAQVERASFHRNHVRELLKVAEGRLASRAISEGEVALARLAVEQSELSFDRTLDDFDSSRATFARLTGASAPLSSAEIPDQIPAVTFRAGSFDASLANVLAGASVPTNESRNFQHLIAQEELNYKMHRVRLLPKLNFVAGANQDEQSYTINTAQKYRLDSLYAGFQVSWHIFDGFAARASQRSSLARRRQLENDHRFYSEQMKALLQSQNRQLGYAARGMSIADRNVVGSEGLLKQRVEDARSGQGSDSDVRVAELGVLDSRISAYGARLDFLMKASELSGLLAQDPALANLPQE